jgi:hypothetical protein
MPLNTTGTLLKISTTEGTPLITKYSARGLSQTLDPIAESNQVELSWNARPIDFSYIQFRLYQSEISCSDFEEPSFDNLWPGMQVDVECCKELSYPVADGFPGRAVVTGSSRTEGDFIFYRPSMRMVILGLSSDFDEYGAKYNWRISLREVPDFDGDS